MKSTIERKELCSVKTFFVFLRFVGGGSHEKLVKNELDRPNNATCSISRERDRGRQRSAGIGRGLQDSEGKGSAGVGGGGCGCRGGVLAMITAACSFYYYYYYYYRNYYHMIMIIYFQSTFVLERGCCAAAGAVSLRLELCVCSVSYCATPALCLHLWLRPRCSACRDITHRLLHNAPVSQHDGASVRL